MILPAVSLIVSALFLLPGVDANAAKNTSSSAFKVEVVTQRSGVVWGFDFLPDGKIILTERSGALVVFDSRTGKSQNITGVPAVYAQGQGGLLDVRVHPGFEKNKLIYFTYAEPSAKASAATTVLARARLENTSLKSLQKIFVAHEAVSTNIHFGSRIEFDGAGHVFVSVGDRNTRERVQDLRYNNGKVIRLKEDGSVPTDNPFVGRKDARPEIWSFGHRNPQGLAREPATGRIWEAEMGPRGGDEVNWIRPGANFGWPVISYGREYSGEPIGEGTSRNGMEQPVANWDPSISPSGIGFYSGEKFPAWKGNLFLSTLSGTHLRRLVISKGQVVSQEVLLSDLGARFRSVREGPDEFLYFSTDDGRIGRLVP